MNVGKKMQEIHFLLVVFKQALGSSISDEDKEGIEMITILLLNIYYFSLE